MKPRLCTRLSVVKPALAQAIETRQEKQRESYKDFKKNHRERQFSENDTFRVKNTKANGNSERWILERVVKKFVDQEIILSSRDVRPDLCMPII